MALLQSIFGARVPKKHWERVYQISRPEEVTWYQRFPKESMELIDHAGISHGDSIIDIGGGTSTLVDCLVAMGYRNVEVLDISGTALYEAKRRLGFLTHKVRWTEADVTTHDFWAMAYDLWHDRAVFHFLTEARQREAYRRALSRALRPGGHVVISTFGPEGPRKCSGLPVMRYDAESLARAMGEGFTLLESRTETHIAPSGHSQQFVYCLLRKDGGKR